MKVHDLKKIYKHALISNSPNQDKDIFNYFDGRDYLHMKKMSLKDEELLLLESMMSQENSKSEWYDFLVKGLSSIPQISNSIQCIHFNVNKINQNQDEWLTNFNSFFDKVYDSFFLNKHAGVILLENWKNSQDELEGFLSILDDDFSTSTRVFIGITTNAESLYEVFNEEQVLFKSNRSAGKITDFIDTFIPYYIAPQLKKSIVGQEIKKILDKDKDLISMIESLWKNQGNLSASAEELYLHRNTLNYRMDKLYNEYGLNLRNIQEVLLCYLLTI